MTVCTATAAATAVPNKQNIRIQVEEFPKQEMAREDIKKSSGLSALLSKDQSQPQQTSIIESRGRGCLKFNCPMRPDKINNDNSNSGNKNQVRKRPSTPPPNHRTLVESEDDDSDSSDDNDDMVDNNDDDGEEDGDVDEFRLDDLNVVVKDLSDMSCSE